MSEHSEATFREDGPKVLRAYLVQRRLPGVQGENGCWSDEALIVTTDAEAAVYDVAKDEPDHMLRCEWRAAPAPEWEVFWPKPEHYHERSVRLERA